MNPKKLPKFKVWLHQNGAEMLPPTNEYEVIRFRCKHGVGVVYSGKKGLNVNADFVIDAYKCFTSAKTWEGRPARGKRKNTPAMKRSLIRRDGPICFYCGNECADGELTQEHLLSAVHGGPNRIENKVLACKKCNEAAGNLPLIDKIKMRENMRNGSDHAV